MLAKPKTDIDQSQSNLDLAHEWACRILNCADPLEKARCAREFRAHWTRKMDEPRPSQYSNAADTRADIKKISNIPERPARPIRPELVSPAGVPRRRLGTPAGRGALLHAIAHIELNAIDLAADMIARFTQDPLLASKDKTNFVQDWSSVCDDEARHFMLLDKRLKALGMAYGDCLAHNGLWDAAMNTRHSFAARLAIAPLVLEARGLDVTPPMIDKLKQAEDMESVKILQIIYKEEINHVRIGAKWFQYVAKSLQESPKALFHLLVKTYFKGQIKPPFNVQARTLAGLSEEYYAPLVKDW